jgi:glutamate-1-semialdehyde 2,1-aminomutase
VKHERSKELFERAQKTLVGGVNSPVRSFKRVGGHPIFAARGEGAYLYDVDQNRYVDFVMSYGPHLYGHARPEIVEAVQRAAALSPCLGFTTENELRWAELLLKRLPNAEKVRALSTGTEACATAIRLARGVTGRDVVAKCSGHYHGHVDALLVDGGSGLATLSTEPVPDSKGLPASVVANSRVIEFNNVESLEALFKNEASNIACLIMEPVMGNMGVVPPDPAFLKRSRELCTRHGALLIFDEVMTGLRVDRYSAQGRFQVRPDLTTLGKVVGGGLPLSALAGPADFMNKLAPLGPVYQAGTLSGNPVSIAGGIAMLELIDRDDPYARLENLGQRVEEVFGDVARKAGLDFRVERVGSMISFYFRKGAVRNARDCRDTNEKQFNAFFWALMEGGFLLPPSPFEASFLSLAHEEIFAEGKRAELSEKLGQAFVKAKSATA